MARITIATPVTADRARVDLAEIFEPFPASDPGAGLTLASARRVIENQHGTIRAELAPGCLRYVIELPLAPEDDAADNVMRESADPGAEVASHCGRRLTH